MRFVIGSCHCARTCFWRRSGAKAECSKPLTLVTSVDLAPVKETRAVLIPVTLAGKPKLLLVDTGARD